MRVLHFYKTYYTESMGGVEQAMRQLCAATARLGVTNEVLTLTRRNAADDILFEGHRVRRLPLDLELASNGMAWAAFGELARRAAGCDLVHYHFPWPFADLAHFIARTGKPAVLTYHSDIVRQQHWLRLYRPLMHRFLGSVDCIVATSPNYLASSPVLARYRDKTRIISYGLEPRLYPAPGPGALAHWRARAGARFFLFTGVLRYYKGLHVLLDALALAPCRVVIAGAGPLQDALRAQASRLGLDQLLFAGAVGEEDKAALLTLCEGVVFPSHLRSEAFGISLLEGAMYGKPLVCCEIGTGTSFINVDGETGFVVAPDNPAALAAAMRRLWDAPALAAAMGKRARSRFLAQFTAAHMGEGYATLYRELLARRQPLSHRGRGPWPAPGPGKAPTAEQAGRAGSG